MKKAFAVIALSSLLLHPVQDKYASYVFPSVPKENLANAKIRKNQTGEYYTIADVTYARWQESLIMDAVLSMNGSPEMLASDDTGHYKIKKAEYMPLNGKGELGSGCAGFFSPEHVIELESSSDLFIGKVGDLGSFTIEFRLLSSALASEGMLFSRTGYLSGTKRGIEILIRSGRVIALFHNMFTDTNGKRRSFALAGGKKLTAGKWHHFAVDFDRLTGKLAKYLDGIEDQTCFATADGTSFSEIFVPSFGDLNSGGSWSVVDESPGRIGGGFNGLMDEFRISVVKFSELKDKKPIADKKYMNLTLDDRLPFNREGIVTSQVLEFPSTGSKVTSFDWNQELPEHTFIWTEFRISDELFHENDAELHWYRIDKGQRNIFAHQSSNGSLLRGRYYQWRAHLVSSPDGKRAPAMSAVRISYQADNPPAVPKLLQAEEAGDGYIRLKWLKNTDADIMGYRIYYGVMPGRYDGIIKTINGELITNTGSKDGFVEITLTNDVIEENKKNDRNRLLTYPILQNTVLYFIAVTAFDSYRPGTPYNHESACSQPVTARPYGGSEIKPISQKPLDGDVLQ